MMHTDHEGVVELGVLVDDVWQCQGLGRGLASHAVTKASRLGHRSIEVHALTSNIRTLRICRSLGGRTLRTSGATVEIVVPVP